MTDPAGGIEDHPYFRWRRDGAIQLTLGLAAAGIVLACAGFDTIAALQRGSGGRGVHLALLAVAGLVGGSVVFQFRLTILALRPLCAAAAALALVGIVRGPPPLALAALAASVSLAAFALSRMRGPHWAEFIAYTRAPEPLPAPPPKR